MIAMVFTHDMNIAGTCERVLCVVYSAPTMRPVMLEIKGTYRYIFSASHATNSALASCQSFLYELYTLVAKLKYFNT